MMSKININKINDLDSLRTARQTEARSADKSGSASAGAKAETGEDKLRFSERASDIGRLVDQLKELPDMREAKINALREQIEAGEYNPSSEDIADAILREER